jgi:hypothetical protein
MPNIKPKRSKITPEDALNARYIHKRCVLNADDQFDLSIIVALGDQNILVKKDWLDDVRIRINNYMESIKCTQ